MTTKLNNRFTITTADGYEIEWANRFKTRREAEEWVDRIGQSDGWETEVEVVFEGDSARHTCSVCGDYTLVDDLANHESTESRWLCVNCQE